MRVAVLSDIHGNLEALEVVLADAEARRPDAWLCLGDFVGYGAAPNECIERIAPRLAAVVAGNHDCAACGRIRQGYREDAANRAAAWTRAVLTPEHQAWLRALPMTAIFRGARLVHASPSEPEEWHYVHSPGDAAFEMESCPEDVCFVGHSHYAGTFELAGPEVRYTRDARVEGRAGRRYLVNVGSVGQPRDNDPRAAYLMWDDEALVFEHVRLEYDVPAAQRRIREAGLPDLLAQRLQWGE